MEKCKFCQEELAENAQVCPNCGKPVSQKEALEVQESQAAAEEALMEPEQEEKETAVETEVAAEAEEAAETAESEEEKPAQQKKATPGKIALAVGAVVVLAAVLIALILAGMDSGEAPVETVPTEAAAETAPATVPADGDPENETCKGSYTVSDEEAVAGKDLVVASIGDDQLTNGQLQVYYWSIVNNYLNSESGYYAMMSGMLDYTRPLDTQMSTENADLTWQQYFLKEALSFWQLYVSLAEEAKAGGMEMTQEQRDYLENITESLEQTAASYNVTVDELMLNNFGPGAGVEEYRAFQERMLEGRGFYEKALEEMRPDQADLENFYKENEEVFVSNGITKDSKYVDVRHILIQVEGGTTDENGATTYSDAEWAACEAEAQAILDTFLAGDQTEDSFAALANEKSEDPGSNTNGGLYENVYMGQMVEPFETWCFDESRAYGDTGLVLTSYGCHVMYYVGSEPMWTQYAESGWVAEQSNAFLLGLAEKYPMEADYTKMILGHNSMGA